MENTEKKNKPTFIIYSEFGELLDIADHLANVEKCETYFYVPNHEYNKIGEGIVPKLKDWEWLNCLGKGYIWLFDGCSVGKLQDWLRSKGEAVFGGSEHGDRLENDRQLGQKWFKKAGFTQPESKNFSNFESATAYVTKNADKKYIMKQNGDAPKSLNHKGKFEGNADMVHHLSEMKKKWNEAEFGKVDFDLMEVVSGLEVAASVFFNGTDYMKNAEGKVVGFLNFEEKKEVEHDMGVTTGEMGTTFIGVDETNEMFKKIIMNEKILNVLRASKFRGVFDINTIKLDSGDIVALEPTCFDKETEILTKNGWKLIKDTDIGELVATLNPETHNLEYNPVQKKIEYNFNGELIKTRFSHTLDFAVTPNHQMYVKVKRGKKKDRFEWKFISAENLSNGVNIKRDANWSGFEIKDYIIPEYIEKHSLGKHKKTIDVIHPEISLPMEDWLKFLGIYLAEGSLSKWGVVISQYVKKDQVRELLKNFPNVKEYKTGFQISSVQLRKHLKQFGLCNEKFVPDYIKELSPRLIRMFLDAFLIGDGSVHKKSGGNSYYTTSKKLADDFQELILKLGKYANISIRRTKGTSVTIKNKTYIRNHDGYSVYESHKRPEAYIDSRQIKREYYNDNVYCVEVENHIIYTRRNGKPAWYGNCRFGVPASSYEFTEGLNMPMSELLSTVARGESKPIEIQMGLGMVMVVVSKPFPVENDLENSATSIGEKLWLLKDGKPVDDFDDEMRKHIHLENFEKSTDEETGEIAYKVATKNGYLLTVTGREGKNIQQVRENLIDYLKNSVYVPDFKIRHDIGKRIEKYYQKK